MGFDPISIGLGAIQGLTSLGGLLGASSAQARAQAARQQALTDLSSNLDTDYQNLVSNDRRNLYGATGVGGDAIASMGRTLGADLAGAGVYNSSATAGALQQALGQQQANLAGLAGSNYANEQRTLNQGREYLTGQRLNLANQQYGEATGNLNYARNGLSGLLGNLGSFNLQRSPLNSSWGSMGQNAVGLSGANIIQNALGRNAGGYGALSPMSPGAGVGGAIGTFNANPFGKPLASVYGRVLGQLF